MLTEYTGLHQFYQYTKQDSIFSKLLQVWICYHKIIRFLHLNFYNIKRIYAVDLSNILNHKEVTSHVPEYMPIVSYNYTNVSMLILHTRQAHNVKFAHGWVKISFTTFVNSSIHCENENTLNSEACIDKINSNTW